MPIRGHANAALRRPGHQAPEMRARQWENSYTSRIGPPDRPGCAAGQGAGSQPHAKLSRMNVNLAIERSIDIPAPYAKVEVLLADLEGTIRRFPKLKRLKKLGENQYLWEMQTI